MKFRRLWFFSVLLFSLVACEKVPLREYRGQFDVLTSHWFENEKTQYVFFSVVGLKASQAKTSWGAAFEMRKGDGPYQPLDFASGVHEHRLIECGDDRICGSISFPANQPESRLTFRYRYNSAAALGEAAEIPVSRHFANTGSDAQSALVYGVFNTDNSRLQVRVHDNFGHPDSEQVKQFGMTRRFQVESTILADVEAPALQFPALECMPHLPLGAGDPWTFRGNEAWSRKPLDRALKKSSACFRAKTLDKNGRPLNEGAAIGRRNPEFASEALAIRTPLQDAEKIPLSFGYCQDAPGSQDYISLEFLRYQQFILGQPESGQFDACFAIGEEARFAGDVDRVLNQKLAESRARSTGVQDFFITVAINHRLAKGISVFQKIIAERLNERIKIESKLTSPRLVGAFVYDSQLANTNIAGASPRIVWCPRAERNGGRDDINCTPRRAGKFELGPLNFRIPMGPFPEMEAFLKYAYENGDNGRSRNPQLLIRSVRTNENSNTDLSDESLYTFFDGQRLNLGADERLKFCRERDNGEILSSLVFKAGNIRGSSRVMGPEEAQETVTRGRGQTLHVGIRWTSSFIGAFTFESAIEGTVFSFIPLSTSFPSRQSLGDRIWKRPDWNVGSLVQKCVHYCDHPFFDEAGVYQSAESWASTSRCPNPKIAEPQE